MNVKIGAKSVKNATMNKFGRSSKVGKTTTCKKAATRLNDQSKWPQIKKESAPARKTGGHVVRRVTEKKKKDIDERGKESKCRTIESGERKRGQTSRRSAERATIVERPRRRRANTKEKSAKRERVAQTGEEAKKSGEMPLATERERTESD